jgi:hypothetical protein
MHISRYWGKVPQRGTFGEHLGVLFESTLRCSKKCTIEKYRSASVMYFDVYLRSTSVMYILENI